MSVTGNEAVGGYIDEALAALGGEGAEFYLTVKPVMTPAVLLSCRYGDCEWDFYVGEMEPWEFVADAREHWETEHAKHGRVGGVT